MSIKTGVIVVGAGHAGCEAALAVARMGRETTLLSTDLDKVVHLSCNPAIGGPGKSQLVREIDALGGQMAQITDRTMINLRRLNTSKGKAMQVMRAQVDRTQYVGEMKWELENQPRLSLTQGLVTDLVVEGKRIKGVRTREGLFYEASAVILTTGTFLNGEIYIGDRSYSAGRSGEPAANELSCSLSNLGLHLKRMNTDTTPRINGKTIDFSDLDRQTTDQEPFTFSYSSEKRVPSDDFPVYLTRTNPQTHKVIRDNIDQNPRYNGSVESAHPRYCPSLESKIIDFPDRDHHKVFLEPEGRQTQEYYLQGIYTSSPPEVQRQIVTSMKGLQDAHIERYGYGIEYDYLPPVQLKPTLETKLIKGLFSAGQINGTTGYEEAGCQGLMAGINAALREDDFVLDRSEAFIGVLIDDLVTKGVTEPYRMLPSRAEYRLTLRENNADLRLTEDGYRLGLIEEDRYREFVRKREVVQGELNRLKEIQISPAKKINEFLTAHNTSPLEDQGASLYQLLKRPELSWSDLAELYPPSKDCPPEVVEEVEIRVKYEGYIQKQQDQIEEFKEKEEKKIPEELDYDQLESLSTEGKEKLKEVRPQTLGQAERIPGVSRSDITVLTIWLS
ncbi:MAG: tRNA uridine-5-carboxymethylaminomethyl(34) synthesis enzyme MnmG [Candidatus Acetothermia bacterium]